MASSIADQIGKNDGKWSGVIFEGNVSDVGDVYGTTVTPTAPFTIPAGKTLNIDNGKTLVVSNGINPTNSGIINHNSGGTINGSGSFTPNQPLKSSITTVEVTLKSGTSAIVQAAPGQTVTIKASVSDKKSGRSAAAVNKVNFYRGDNQSGTLLGIADFKNGTASLDVQLTGDGWKSNVTPYSITADFGGGGTFQASTATTSLTVKRMVETTPAIQIDYINETLTGFITGGSYTINNTPVSPNADGTLSIEPYLNSTLSIVKKSSDTTTTDDSATQSLPIPARPDAPTVGTVNNTKDINSFTFTSVSGMTYEYQISNSGNWTALAAASVPLGNIDLGAKMYRCG